MRFSRLARASAPALVVAAVAVAPAAAQRTPISVCVLDAGMPTMVTVSYDTQTGDTTAADGRRFAEAFPLTAAYAANQTWYIDNEPIELGDDAYVKYGLPRVLGVNEVYPFDEFRTVTLFAEPVEGTPEVLYVPVRPGCEFQPYQRDVDYDAVDDDESAEADRADRADYGYVDETDVYAIESGETLSGTLDEDDAMYDDGSYFDVYTFTGSAGERVRITLRSGDFDAYVALGYWYDDFVEEFVSDDDSGGGFDAQLEFTLPDDDVYGILVNSLMPEELGAYTITLERL